MFRLLSVVLPIALQQSITSFHFILDNFMATQIGYISIAAVGSANKFMLLLRGSLLAIAGANSILSAQYSGQNRKDGIVRSLTSSIAISFIFSFIFLILYFTNRSFILSTFTENKLIQSEAARYLDVMVFSSIPLSVILSLISSLRSRNFLMLPLIASAASLGINYLLSVILVFGKFGFTQMGVQGSALATVLAEVFATILVIFLAKKKRLISFSEFLSYPINLKFIYKYLKLSLPLVSSSILTSLSMILSHNIFGKLGNNELTAYGIISPIEAVIFDLFAGFGIAAIVLIGAELGKKNFDKAYAEAKVIAAIGASVAALLGICIYLMDFSWMKESYGIEDQTLSYVKYMFRVYACFVTTRIFNSIFCNGILNSGGDSFFLMIVAILADWLAMIPWIYLGVYFWNWDITNVYLAMNMSEVANFLLFFFRFRSKKWMKNLTE